MKQLHKIYIKYEMWFSTIFSIMNYNLFKIGYKVRVVSKVKTLKNLIKNNSNTFKSLALVHSEIDVFKHTGGQKDRHFHKIIVS